MRQIDLYDWRLVYRYPVQLGSCSRSEEESHQSSLTYIIARQAKMTSDGDITLMSYGSLESQWSILIDHLLGDGDAG